MRITILHNISRDAGFGLNSVFEVPVGKRPAAVANERHPLVVVFAYWMPLEDGGEAGADTGHVPSLQYGLEHLLNIAFREFNVGDSELAEAYRARQLRSLSVGDVVLVGHRAFACERAGWRRVPVEQLNILRGPKADAAVRAAYEFDDDEPLAISVPLSPRQYTQALLKAYGQQGAPDTAADAAGPSAGPAWLDMVYGRNQK